MGNLNQPMGLRPVATLGNSGYKGAIETFYVPSSDATAIGLGDPVKLAGGLSADGFPIATRGSVGGTVIGVCVGVRLQPTDLTQTYRKSSTSMYILVDTDPNTVYEIQEDSNGGSISLANGTKNASLVLGIVDTVTGSSKTQLQSSSAAANAALDILLLRPALAVDNVFPATNAKWLVRLNLHQYGPGAVKVGV